MSRPAGGFSLYSLVGAPVAVENGALSRFLAGFEWDGDPVPPLLRIGYARHASLYGVESVSASHPVAHILRSERERRSLLLSDRDFSRVTLCGTDPAALAELSLAALVTRLSTRGTVLVHGAAVRLPNGTGLCFIGGSGVGKSTQAELWRRYRGADILNGDKVFLHLQRSRLSGHCEVVAHGSPWNGSSPYRMQACGRLSAIVALHRAPPSSPVRLPVEEATATLLSRAVLPGWDDTLASVGAAVFDSVARMALTVPLYTLSCSPDCTAVEAVEAGILAPSSPEEAVG